MVSFKLFASAAVAGLVASVTAAPSANVRRASPDNQVWLTSTADHCLILPRNRESIGDSERPGGMRSYCTKPYDDSQGQLASNFWTAAHFKKTNSYVQITGCINPSALRVFCFLTMAVANTTRMVMVVPATLLVRSALVTHRTSSLLSRTASVLAFAAAITMPTVTCRRTRLAASPLSLATTTAKPHVTLFSQKRSSTFIFDFLLR